MVEGPWRAAGRAASAVPGARPSVCFLHLEKVATKPGPLAND